MPHPQDIPRTGPVPARGVAPARTRLEALRARLTESEKRYRREKTKSGATAEPRGAEAVARAAIDEEFSGEDGSSI